VNDRKPPRFPYVGALLCAACVGAAVWTWMRYSYVWDVAAEEIGVGCKYDERRPLPGYYVRVRGTPMGSYVNRRCWLRAGSPGRSWGKVTVFGKPVGSFTFSPRNPPRLSYTGRVVGQEWKDHQLRRLVFVSVDTTAGRFTGASVAGLVVGAWGVFVFAAALKAWLNQRRALHVETAESDT
jgi:hypothetical protein